MTAGIGNGYRQESAVTVGLKPSSVLFEMSRISHFLLGSV
jgi:hypothetical protein